MRLSLGLTVPGTSAVCRSGRSAGSLVPMTDDPDRVMTPGRTLVFAVAAGLVVGNLYLAQPLIEVVADSLHVPSARAATLVTVTQVGYALGVFLLAPLGDVVNRRRLIPLILCCSAIALATAAAAPAFPVLIVALGLVGMTTVSAQLLSPLASELAAPDERGRVVSTVVSGALVGILLSRTVSGLIADVLSWRAIYAAVAGAAAILGAVLRVVIPQMPTRDHVPYRRLLASVFTTAAAHRAVPLTLLISAAAFAVFSMFWTSLTYLLTEAPFSYSVGQIGTLGLAGLAGALAARRAGRLHDRGWSVPATGFALTLLSGSLVGAWFARTSIIGLVVVVVVLDIAVQGVLVLAQARLLSLPGSARSRLNTAIIVGNFIGGAVGSAASGWLWTSGGWRATMAAALGIALLALVAWATGRVRLAAHPAEPTS